ncbi:TldD/PmbA family protein, partial [bacterium]|nr:TldD/PmbA family protein [candidate division CSSED10-310 bacterium]
VNRISRRYFIENTLKTMAFSGFLASGILPFSPVSARDYMEEVFRIDPEQLEKILKAAGKNGGDFSEIFIERRITRHGVFQNGQFVDLREISSEGLGIRIVEAATEISGYSDGVDFKKAVNIARDLSKTKMKSEKSIKMINILRYPEWGRGVIVVAKPFEQIPEALRLSALKKLSKIAKYTSNLIREITLHYTEELRVITVANSLGIYRTDYQPLFSVGAHVISEDNGRYHRGFRQTVKRGGYELLGDTEFQKTAQEAARESVEMLTAKPLPPGRYPVIVGEGCGELVFYRAIGRFFEARKTVDGINPLENKLNRQIASPFVTIVDNPSYIGGPGSAHIDDEGRISTKTTVVDNGKFERLLTDTTAARERSIPFTPNARRTSYHTPPTPCITNLFIEPGNTSPEEMIADISRGIYIRSFMPGSVSQAGDFSFPVREAYRIENGSIGIPIKDMIFTGNTSTILGKIDAVGSDFFIVPGMSDPNRRLNVSWGQPSLQFADINFTQ